MLICWIINSILKFLLILCDSLLLRLIRCDCCIDGLAFFFFLLVALVKFQAMATLAWSPRLNSLVTVKLLDHYDSVHSSSSSAAARSLAPTSQAYFFSKKIFPRNDCLHLRFQCCLFVIIVCFSAFLISINYFQFSSSICTTASWKMK